MGVYIYQSGTEKELKNAYIGEYQGVVQTFDFQNDGDLGWTGQGIGYGIPDFVTGEGWKIGTSGSSLYQGYVKIPDAVYIGTLKKIKIYWYKSSVTTSAYAVGTGLWDVSLDKVIAYSWRNGNGGWIRNWNGGYTSAIDATGETSIEFVMEDNGDITVIINNTNTYNIGAFASNIQSSWSNKNLQILLGRWAVSSPQYIRKVEITTV